MEEKNNDLDDVNRAAIKLIHADGFFPEGDAERLCAASENMKYVEKDYGLELAEFNLILPDIENVFSKFLGEEIVIDRKNSGVIRKPYNGMIHFESFKSPHEWCFILALERNTLNVYKHVEDIRYGKFDSTNSKTVFDGYQFNYKNIFEWDVMYNILLDSNEGIFIRPWVFHSLQEGKVQYYRLLSKRHMKKEENKVEEDSV
jgi:hypothetical protein